jgi:hypothetical protein
MNSQDLSGARLVGAVTFLNVPFIPYTHDTILTFRFVADSVPCIPGAGTCSQPCTDDASCSDGDPCNGVEFCHLGNCQPGVPISCDDGNECNGTETCDSANGGMCNKSPLQQCNADNPCTVGTCRPDFLCVYTNEPNGKPCDDGNLCTGPDPITGGVCPNAEECDKCQDGVCTGAFTNQAPTNCEDDNVCNGIMACDPATGMSCVQIGPPLVCAPDGNPCTDDGCDATLGCNPPNTAPCDDGNACTGPDVCANRECHGDPSAAAAACVGGSTVCGPQACDPATGACITTPVNCDDMNPCTDDSCNPDAALPEQHCALQRQQRLYRRGRLRRWHVHWHAVGGGSQLRRGQHRLLHAALRHGERGLCPDTTQLRRRQRLRRYRDLRPRHRLSSRTADRL